MTRTISRTQITSLDSLYQAMQRNDPSLPQAHGEADWSSLPTFGGEEPRNTAGVWSWDADRVIVGTCAADIRIEGR